MLSPDDRQLLLDALRPPDGANLDLAVGTTFTLDLHALLVAPLAFAMFDWTTGEDGTPNIVAVLESLRRHADRTTVFCQAGEIKVPSKYQSVLTYLEERIVPVTPRETDRIFHPKAWILRFTSDHGPTRYRILCASRNLTFDRSWDTLLTLDGEVRTDGTGDDLGFGSFVELLEELTPDDRPEIRRDLTTIQGELGDVRFELPDGFRDVRFHTVDGDRWPFPRDRDRTLVVSPFLTAGALSQLRSSQPDSDVLISRSETLDRTPLEGWPRRFVLSPLVVQPDALASSPEEESDDDGTELQGLHAKLFLFERGNEVRLFAGSANATDAAFNGNVELLAELVTSRDSVGIDQLLSPGDGEPAFRDLLDEHAATAVEDATESAAEAVERVLDLTRRRLGALRYDAHYTPATDELYGLELTATGELDLPPEIGSIRCWRLSAGSGHSYQVELSPSGFAVSFGHVAVAGITAFFTIEVTAEIGDHQDSSRFVVAAKLHGAPEGRRERVLTDLLTSRADVLRYLLFLLADLSGTGIDDLADALMTEPSGSDSRRFNIDDAPLLESLLSALRHDPSRLDHIASLIKELRSGERGDDLLPQDLDSVWEPIWEARKGLPA